MEVQYDSSACDVFASKQKIVDSDVREIEEALENGSTTSGGDSSSDGSHTPPTVEIDGIDNIWQVVGGSDKGGIIVRERKDLASPLENERLATGALVRVLVQDDARIRYELIAGTGPSSGWVSSATKDGKELLHKFVADGPCKAKASEKVLDGIDSIDAAMSCYGERFNAALTCEFIHSKVAVGQRKKTNKLQVSQKQINTRLEGTLVDALGADTGLDVEVDSDGEEMELCCRCGLPVDEIAYPDEERSFGLLHGECLAQLKQQKIKDAEDARMSKEAKVKQAHREEYNIGWSPKEQIPRNISAAQKLGCGFVPSGMVCLMLDGPRSVRVVSTVQPGAAVNLEYLSIALNVRQREGREALFSLDPLNSGAPLLKTDDPKNWMQRKRFEPEWIAGTSVGELMFQADYILKELSMGACEQPVVGMKSVFDFFEHNNILDSEWCAREWFVIRKAEVRVSEDNVLVPYCKMGVEAREQVWGPDGMEDALISSPDHPLVRYAEEFSRNFDLIAERKSAIYHLRELAKASLLAKHLLDNEFELDEAWFNLAGEMKQESSLEVPCLWTDRAYSKIQLQNGKLVNDKKSLRPLFNHVFGGVSMALPTEVSRVTDDMRKGAFKAPGVSAIAPVGAVGAAPPPPPAIVSGFAARISAPVAALGVPTLTAPVRAGAAQFASRAAIPSMALAPGGLEGRPSPEAQGVDLNLNSFDVKTQHRVVKEASVATWQGEGVTIAEAFWSSMNGSDSTLGDEDRQLLNDIFNPHLADRREEGDLFAPPDTSFSHVRKLCALVKQEEVVRSFRKQLFLSEDFVMTEPGPQFPVSWSSSFEIANGRGAAKMHNNLIARDDFESMVNMFDLEASTPIFDKSTEDGMRFRIYRFGSLEVRTTQEHGDEQELVGMVFSMHPQRGITEGKVKDSEHVTKAIVYVAAAQAQGDFVLNEIYRRYFTVLETEAGNVVVMERLGDGTVLWEENPSDLEDRKSLAKFLRSSRAKRQITIAEMKDYKGVVLPRKATPHHVPASHISRSTCKRFAQGVCDRVARGDSLAPARTQKDLQSACTSFSAWDMKQTKPAALPVQAVKAPKKAFELKGPTK